MRVDSTGSRPDGLSHESHEHAERAMEILSPAGPLLVAFSGGADSALVLTMAVRTLGAEQVIAATSVAPSVARSELVSAEAFTAELGVRHEWPHTREIERADYRANGRDRCYFCKSELADTLLGLAEQLKCRTVITGTNADDAVDPFRPGIRAADERGSSRHCAMRGSPNTRSAKSAGLGGYGPGTSPRIPALPAASPTASPSTPRDSGV